jgi:hypothetical protein
MNPIFKFFFELFGWKVVGKVAPDVKKAIFAVCPHWYNTDFFIGLGTRAVKPNCLNLLSGLFSDL